MMANGAFAYLFALCAVNHAHVAWIYRNCIKSVALSKSKPNKKPAVLPRQALLCRIEECPGDLLCESITWVMRTLRVLWKQKLLDSNSLLRLLLSFYF